MHLNLDQPLSEVLPFGHVIAHEASGEFLAHAPDTGALLYARMGVILAEAHEAPSATTLQRSHYLITNEGYAVYLRVTRTMPAVTAGAILTGELLGRQSLPDTKAKMQHVLRTIQTLSQG